MSEKLVTIATFTHPHEAYFAKTLLDSAEIECFVLDDNIRGIYGGLLSPVFRGVKLQVRAEDAEAAGEILDALEDELENKLGDEPKT